MPNTTNIEARRRVVNFAETNGGALSRAQARKLGLSSRSLRTEVESGRLRADGRALRVVGAPPSERARWLIALANAGPRCALDGVTALRAAGLEHFEDSVIHVGGPAGARVDAPDGVQFHCQRRWDPADVMELDGMRVVRPEVAAVNAALWAPTMRSASTLLAMTCQQRLCEPADLLVSARRLPPRLRRSRDVRNTIIEISGGIDSINELDFARGLRSRGLPEPTRQRRLASPSGLFYLDAEFEPYGVHVEIHGAHHRLADRAYRDDLKANEVALRDGCSLRISSSAVRDDLDEPYEQIRRALHTRGWIG